VHNLFSYNLWRYYRCSFVCVLAPTSSFTYSLVPSAQRPFSLVCECAPKTCFSLIRHPSVHKAVRSRSVFPRCWLFSSSLWYTDKLARGSKCEVVPLEHTALPRGRSWSSSTRLFVTSSWSQFHVRRSTLTSRCICSISTPVIQQLSSLQSVSSSRFPDAAQSVIPVPLYCYCIINCIARVVH